MPTIYFVSSGEYSNYCVLGAFSSRALAEEWIGPLGAGRYEVEERELDSMEGRPVLTGRVDLDLETGEVCRDGIYPYHEVGGSPGVRYVCVYAGKEEIGAARAQPATVGVYLVGIDRDAMVARRGMGFLTFIKGAAK